AADEIADIELAAGLAEERRQVAETLAVLETNLAPIMAEGPELAVAPELGRRLEACRHGHRAPELRQRPARLLGVPGETGAPGAGPRLAVGRRRHLAAPEAGGEPAEVIGDRPLAHRNGVVERDLPLVPDEEVVETAHPAFVLDGDGDARD